MSTNTDIVESVAAESLADATDARQTYLQILRRRASGASTDEDRVGLREAMGVLGKTADNLRKDADIVKQAVALETKAAKADADNADPSFLKAQVDAQRDLDKLVAEFRSKERAARQRLAAAIGARNRSGDAAFDAKNKLSELRAQHRELFCELNPPSPAVAKTGFQQTSWKPLSCEVG
jgi:hypothetical protein